MNLIGGGVGPLLEGIMSDYLVPLFGGNGLRYSLVAGIGGVVHFWISSNHYRQELVS